MTKVVALGRSTLLYNSIQYLHQLGYQIPLIITDEAYSEYEHTHKDFQDLAKELGARFIMGGKLNDDVISAIASVRADFCITVNWRYMIPATIIDMFQSKILNLHVGKLPAYKGNATPNWAIINEEADIYVDIHKVTVDLDAGDIINRASMVLTENTYVGDIIEFAKENAPLLFERAIAKLASDNEYYLAKGSAEGIRCYPRIPEDGKISWDNDAKTIHNLIRATSKPYPGAFAFYKTKKVVIWRANIRKDFNDFYALPGTVLLQNKNTHTVLVACAKDVIEIEEIEVEGEKILPSTFFNSIRHRLT